jgi:hypothetical protein
MERPSKVRVPALAFGLHTHRGVSLGGLAGLLVVVLVTPVLFAPPSWTQLASPSGSVQLVSSGPTPAVQGLPAPFPTPIRHVVVIILENEEAKDVLANATYERGLARNYSYAGQFYSPMHYSLPNYLAATSGYTTNLFAPFKQTSIGSLALIGGRSWKEYEESMPYPCDLSSGITAAGYDPNHNPFALYEPFINNATLCATHMVNFTRLNSDLADGTMPNYALIVPNVTHDGHNTSLQTADAWLSSWLPTLLSNAFFRTAAIFLTYDEGTTNLGVNGTSGGGHIYLAMISPFARMGYTSPTPYTTYSLLTTSEWLLGLGSTHTNDNWSVHPPIRDLFNVPVQVTGKVVSAAGVPVAGILVADGHGVNTRTNSTGNFVLDLPSGNYTLYAPTMLAPKGEISISVSGVPLQGLIMRLK